MYRSICVTGLIAGFSILAMAAAPAVAQTVPAAVPRKSLSQGPNRMELTLERNTKSGWRAVDPGTIFSKNDLVRFKFRTNFSGYLYVMNQGTGGSYTKLFPRQDTGTANRIESGKDYMVPATEGAFRIDGPAGHDVIYWVVSPIEMGGENNYQPLPPPPPNTSKMRASLTPRCDDAVLRARGDCVDSDAGPQAVADQERLPENIKSAAEKPQELIFRKQQNRSVVSSPVPLSGPVIFEFRLAHK